MRMLKCEYCDYMSPSKSSVIYHTYTHTGDKPFKCEFCDKRFTQKSNLKSHLISHGAGEYNAEYKCDLCEFTTKWKGSYVIHARTHTGEKPYSCEECGQKFSQMTHRSTHMREIHGSSTAGHVVAMKPFKCDHENCNKSFKRIDHLNRHKLVHTQERNYKCDSCNKCFFDVYGLRLHERIHQGDASKIYKCHKCDYSCRYKNGLDTHLRSHLNLKIDCKVCKRSFKHFHLLRLHTKRMHKTNVSTHQFVQDSVDAKGARVSLLARCTICTIGFKCRDDFDKHYLEVHGRKFKRAKILYNKNNTVKAKKMKALAFIEAMEKKRWQRTASGKARHRSDSEEDTLEEDSDTYVESVSRKRRAKKNKKKNKERAEKSTRKYERKVKQSWKIDNLHMKKCFVVVKRLDVDKLKFDEFGRTKVIDVGSQGTLYGNPKTVKSKPACILKIRLKNSKADLNPTRQKRKYTKKQKNVDEMPEKGKKTRKYKKRSVSHGVIHDTAMNDANTRVTLEIENAESGNVLPYDSRQYERMMDAIAANGNATGNVLNIEPLKNEDPEPFNITPHEPPYESTATPWPIGEIIKSPNQEKAQAQMGFNSLRELAAMYM